MNGLEIIRAIDNIMNHIIYLGVNQLIADAA